ncbi:MAG: small, acid-soluble spore protein, alpha/beta type [Limnochordia bacterium]|jgi:hypothetical protein
MGRKGNAHPQARAVLEQFKYEVASELGLLNKVQQVGWENMTTREAGQVGGQMVRRFIQQAEAELAKEVSNQRQ